MSEKTTTCQCGSRKAEGERFCPACDRLAIKRNADAFKDSTAQAFGEDDRQRAIRMMRERQFNPRLN